LERDLQVGCADLLIENWDNYTLPQSEIESIPGVYKTTTVTLVSIHFENIPESDSQYTKTTTYHVKMLAVHNCEEFNQVIDWKRLGNTRYSEDDIKELSRNLTYLMNKENVKEYGYNDPEVHLHNTFYGEKEKWLTLEYVNSFRWFPLLPLVEENTDPYSHEYSFNLVTSLQTIQLLENASSSDSATFSEYLLLRATADGNLTSISEEINNIYDKSSIISRASIESELRLTTNKFTSIFTILCSIIVVLVVFLYGYIRASTIYQYRLRVIEAEFRLGINREEILKGMILEVLLTTVIPILVSLLFGILYLLLLKQLIPIRQIYCPFTLWLPWWILLLTILISSSLIIGGNSASLVPQVRNYRPVKVE
jgi:ABC-type antimicrobial peptide transport system permease subunit